MLHFLKKMAWLWDMFFYTKVRKHFPVMIAKPKFWISTYKKSFLLSNYLKKRNAPFSEKNGMTLRHDLLNKGMYKRSAEFEKLSEQKCFLLSDYLKYSNFVCFVKQKQKLLRFFSFKLGVGIHRKFSVKITIYYQGIPFHSSCLGIIPYCFY